MKNKGLLITTIAFFLLVNTSYYWFNDLGDFEIPVFFILVFVFAGLGVEMLRLLYIAIKEKFKNKHRILTIGILTTVLTIVYLKPHGLINFEKFESKELLVARREGSANCMTTFKLIEDNKFIEKNICFGITETTGNYKIANDTLFFENVELGRHENEFYEYAVIRPSKIDKNNLYYDLIRYKDFKDTTGHILWIVKNDLDIQTEKPKR